MHKAEVVQDDKLDQMPYLAKCSCGTEGHFRLEPLAYMWINRHLESLGEDPIHMPIETVATEQHEPRHTEQHEAPHRLRR